MLGSRTGLDNDLFGRLARKRRQMDHLSGDVTSPAGIRPVAAVYPVVHVLASEDATTGG